MTKKYLMLFFIIIILLLFFFIYTKYNKKENVINIQKEIEEDISYSSNIIKDVKYSSRDAKGNEYIIDAKEGEIDYSNSNVVFLKKVTAIIKLTNSNLIKITSDFGKYNTDNYDTIFNENVIINYLDNQIEGEYLDFSINRNSMIISKNVIYTNLENILLADVIEMNIETKDTKIFMFEKNKKVKVKNKN